jgi:hypothetical protein
LLQFGSYSQEPWTIFPVKKTIELPGIALDVWKSRYDIGNIDIMKMNIQGGELAALRGGVTIVEDAIAIEIEMSFSQTYLSAPLMSDIDPVLRMNHFEFFDLIGPNICSFKDTPVRFDENRNLQSWGFPRHKIFEGHFLYFRDPFAYPENRQMPTEKVLKLACIGEVYGHVEYSFALLNWLRDARPELQPALLPVVTEAADVYRRAFKTQLSAGQVQDGRSAAHMSESAGLGHTPPGRGNVPTFSSYVYRVRNFIERFFNRLKRPR